MMITGLVINGTHKLFEDFTDEDIEIHVGAELIRRFGKGYSLAEYVARIEDFRLIREGAQKRKKEG